MKRMAIYAALLLAVAMPGAATAEWYQIELIVFRYATPEAEAQWAAAPAVPDFGIGQRLADEPTEAPADLTQPVAYLALPKHALNLAGAYRLLARTGGYEPLIHTAWRQADSGGRAVYLSDRPGSVGPTVAAPPVAGPGVEGLVTLRIGQYLRVETDFVAYEGGVPVRVSASTNVTLDAIHYLDHPLLGVLLQVTRYPLAGAP